ncbi:MAG: sialate O-acetylesterase [Lachnospiraceae bacterium]|nr:sialate O-acetylesterase [Lachnospiraceae bacterium]
MIRCHELFSDNMILQRDKQVCIWGECDQRDDVNVSIDGVTVKVQPSDGCWKVYLPQHKAGGPYTMSVTQGNNAIIFNQVMYGEVFLASGQSNMELELKNSENGEAESLMYSNRDIRFYNVLKTGYLDEQVMTQIKSCGWENCVDGKSGHMSAVAYYAAKKIYEELRVPIGIIDCYQGGTSIASWLPEDVLWEYELGRSRIEEYAILVGDKTDEEYDREVEEYWIKWHRWDDAVREAKRDNPYASFEEITAVAGECPWPQPAGRKSVFRPSGCYDSMIRRTMPYTIRGIWYYQGESDEDKAKEYLPIMKALVDDWRNGFKDESLYFVITQLPMYIEKGAVDNGSWAVIRDAQIKISQDDENIGLLCLADCGELGNIHPVDKKTPGTRLGDLVLEEMFHSDRCGRAMVPSRIYKQADNVVIECENTYGEICVAKKEDANYPAQFEVAGDGENYYACDYTIQDNKIILSGDNVKNATSVRYGWTNYGIVKILNNGGIPLATFGPRKIS